MLTWKMQLLHRECCTCTDKLLSAELHFFLSVAGQLEPFLLLYRTDKPMVPFISTDLLILVKSLMERFVKPALVKEVASASRLINIDIIKADSCVNYSKKSHLFTTENAVKALWKNVMDRQTAPRFSSALPKLPTRSCCQAVEQDCRLVCTANNLHSWIPD